MKSGALNEEWGANFSNVLSSFLKDHSLWVSYQEIEIFEIGKYKKELNSKQFRINSDNNKVDIEFSIQTKKNLKKLPLKLSYIFFSSYPKLLYHHDLDHNCNVLSTEMLGL